MDKGRVKIISRVMDAVKLNFPETNFITNFLDPLKRTFFLIPLETL